jgi:hypothetical protein
VVSLQADGHYVGLFANAGAFEVRDRLAIEALGFAALAEQDLLPRVRWGGQMAAEQASMRARVRRAAGTDSCWPVT